MPTTLTIPIFLPAIGSLLLLLIGRDSIRALKVATLGFTLLTFVALLPVAYVFDSSALGFQFVEKVPWIPSLGISYHVGIDGMSLLLVLLTAFLAPLTLIGTWNSVKHRVKEYAVMVLLLETAMLGVFAALDTFLFYIFFESILIPMYFIIGIWGGVDRVYATVKFFIYTLFGSLLMLVAIIAVGILASGTSQLGFTTDLSELARTAPSLPLSVQLWLFAAFALSFAIKVPLWPLHTWLPDAHVQAPTLGSVILAGVLLKIGTYGFLRFNVPLFPQASVEAAPLFSVLAVIGIIFGALVAMVQPDMKKLVAYSSVSHLGFVVLGIFSFTEEGIQGAILQMVNHGLSTGALFLLVGMIYERAHTRMIADFSGVAKVMPRYSSFFFIVALSSIGLPGLNGFVGEFLVLLGTFKSPILNSYYYTVFAAIAVILAAVYMLWMYNRVFFGPPRESYNGHSLSDIGRMEIASLAPIVLFIVWIGVYPSPFLKSTSVVAKQTVQLIHSTVGSVVGTP